MYVSYDICQVRHITATRPHHSVTLGRRPSWVKLRGNETYDEMTGPDSPWSTNHPAPLGGLPAPHAPFPSVWCMESELRLSAACPAPRETACTCANSLADENAWSRLSTLEPPLMGGQQSDRLIEAVRMRAAQSHDSATGCQPAMGSLAGLRAASQLDIDLRAGEPFRRRGRRAGSPRTAPTGSALWRYGHRGAAVRLMPQPL